jgi:hypothetical protein
MTGVLFGRVFASDQDIAFRQTANLTNHSALFYKTEILAYKCNYFNESAQILHEINQFISKGRQLFL